MRFRYIISEIPFLLHPLRHTVDFAGHRAGIVLERMTIVALVFSILTPLWIIIDVAVFPPEQYLRFAVLRGISTAMFLLVALGAVHGRHYVSAFFLLLLMFSVPLVFYLLAVPSLETMPGDRMGRVVAYAYFFLPFVVVAGVAVFPLTLVEIAAITGPVFVVSFYVYFGLETFSLVRFLQDMWLMALVAAVSVFSSLLQLLYARDSLSERQRLQLYESVFQHAMHAIALTDADTRFIHVNPAFERVTGYRRGEVLGERPSLLSSGVHAKEFYQDMWRAIGERGFWAGEIWNQRKNGDIYPEHLEINAIRDDSGAVTNYVAFFTDTTKLKDLDSQVAAYAEELRQANAELREALEQAQAASRAKSEFLANMSHELRTPLNAIIGFSEVMRDGMLGPLPQVYQGYANDIHESGQLLLTLISDVLDLAKVEAGTLSLNVESVDLGEILAFAMASVEGRADKEHVFLSVETPETPVTVRADPVRLKQVFLNLLSNGVKFTPAGGRVTASVAPLDDGAEVRVSDTGTGLTEAEAEQALSPFGQVAGVDTRAHEGAGLGLPLARRLVRMHGGTLTLDSVKGEGTTAIVRLPQNPDAAEEGENTLGMHAG